MPLAAGLSPQRVLQLTQGEAERYEGPSEAGGVDVSDLSGRLLRSCSALVPIESGPPSAAESLAVGCGKAALDKSWSCVILSYDSLNMLFQLNYKSGKAVYLQLVDQVKAAAASGALHAGSPLPGIRPLAEELRVNRNTVAKAYSALESQGVIETIAGKGCFVRANHSPFKKEVRRKLLAETLDGAVIQAHHLQIDKADFLRVAEERFDALEHKRHAANS